MPPGPPGGGYPGPPGGPYPPPGPPPRRPRKGLVIGAGAAAAVLVAGLLGFVVWEAVGGRPYAELGSCRDLLPAQVVDTVPEADRPRAEGGFTSVDEQEWYFDDPEMTDAGYLGQLNCQISERDGTDWVINVDVSLFDHELSREYFEDTAEDVEDRVRDLERGREDDVEEWSRITVGDGGLVILYDYDGDRSAVSAFGDVNVFVFIHYLVPEDVDTVETRQFMEDFSGQVRRQLARTSERA